MKNNFGLDTKDSYGFPIAICILVIVSLAHLSGCHVLINNVLSDSFHYGEYFATLTTLLDSQLGVYPFTIHGALDYIPGMIALNAFGENAYFFQTWFIYFFFF